MILHEDIPAGMPIVMASKVNVVTWQPDGALESDYFLAGEFVVQVVPRDNRFPVQVVRDWSDDHSDTPSVVSCWISPLENNILRLPRAANIRIAGGRAIVEFGHADGECDADNDADTALEFGELTAECDTEME